MKILRRFSEFGLVALAGVLLTLGLSGCGAKEGVAGEVAKESSPFSKEVEEVIQAKMDLVTNDVASDPRIIRLVGDSNEKNKDIPWSEIKRLDEGWIAAKGIDSFIKGFISNETSQILLDIQEADPGYAELFIADNRGLIVGLTNKTSDYYQADEDWWVQGFNEGRGKSFHGEIEYDESAMSEAIALYIPIIDPDTGRAIGVMKAIVDITAIKMEL